MIHFINQSDLIKNTRLLAVLFAILLLPQGIWAQDGQPYVDFPDLTFTAPSAAAYIEVTEWTIKWSERKSEYPVLDNPHQLRDITYSSSNTDVATIDENSGEITPVAPGVTTITAYFPGGLGYDTGSASYTLTFTDDREEPTAAVFSFDSSTASATYGDASVESPTLRSGQMGNNISITFSSTNTAVATVDATSGVVTIISAGTTDIRAQFAGNNYYKPATVSYTLTVNPRTVIVDGGITANNKTYDGTTTATLNGSGATIHSVDGGNGIINGDVVTVSASGSFADANVGTGKTVTISGITLGGANAGNYKLDTSSNQGTTTASITALVATLNWSNTSFTYDGADHVPTATVSNLVGSDACTVTVTGAQSSAGTHTATASALSNSNYSLPTTATQSFTIAKASSTVSFPKTTYNAEVGTPFQAPTATTSPSALTVTYASSKTAVATVNETTGAVTIVGEGETTITATFAGNNNYSGSSASYTLTVVDNTVKYDLWIGDTRVTEKNCSDILGDGDANKKIAGSFQYIPSLNKLFITNTSANLKIETKNNEGLTIYLAPNSTNSVSSIVYTGNGNVPLTITTDGNYPGTLTLSSANGYVISGFSSLTLEQNIVIINPDNIAYDGNNKRLGATSATIGVPLSPITDDEPIQPDGNELKPEAGSNDVNKVVDDILYTLGNANDNNEGDGYDDEGCIVINTVTTDKKAVEVTHNCIPGTDEYLEGFKGLTFMVPAGNGTIKFDMQTLDGYVMKVMIGNAAPVTIMKTDKGFVEIPYNVGEPTYVYAYNAGKSGDGGNARSIHKGKKTTVHIKIYSISISSKKVKSSNPASEASGGTYTGDTSELEGQEVLSGEEIEKGRGDVNGDSAVNAADIVEIVNTIMGKQSTVFDKNAADLNGDGAVNAADIVEIVKKIMGQ